MLSKIQTYSLFKSGLLWQYLVDYLFFLASSFSSYCSTLWLSWKYGKNMRNLNKWKKLLIFIGMTGQFMESMNKMRVFSKVKENKGLQLRLMVFPWSMVTPELIILDDSTFEGKTSPFPLPYICKRINLYLWSLKLLY